MFDVIELSRLQFSLTAMYHFLFVPLTLGLAFLIAIMETVYVISGKNIYIYMTKFWGKLFSINFALGVVTGLTMEFQFGTNWSYFSHYVGDIFGAPLAIEGLMAFFLESTFVGLFLFGWNRLSKIQHMIVTWLVAIGSNISSMWILVANGWMQNPISSTFNYETMRMEMISFADMVLNPIAQVKFVHTVTACYCTGAIFVLGISSYYLINGRYIAFAKRSFAIASSFGIAAVLSVIILGDESGYKLSYLQKTKFAAIEAEWNTEQAPASFTILCIPNQKDHINYLEIRIPYFLGIISTRSIDRKIIGLKDLLVQHEMRIRNGIKAYNMLQHIRKGSIDVRGCAAFNSIKQDIGYGLLLKRYTDNISSASELNIKQATSDSIPYVAPIYFSFRVMVACGILMFLLITTCLWIVLRNCIGKYCWFHRAMLYAIPLPWIAIESGWFISEYGRQPWAISEILPTDIAKSNLTTIDILFSIGLICFLYTIFFVFYIYLIYKYVIIGPSRIKNI